VTDTNSAREWAGFILAVGHDAIRMLEPMADALNESAAGAVKDTVGRP
jgi:hypothetical protein